MYYLLAWKWIGEKFDIKWKYLLCFISVDTAFLLCGADLCYIILCDCIKQNESHAGPKLFLDMAMAVKRIQIFQKLKTPCQYNFLFCYKGIKGIFRDFWATKSPYFFDTHQ